MNDDVPIALPVYLYGVHRVNSLSLSPSAFTLGRSWSWPVSVTVVNTPEIRTEIAFPLQQPAQLPS